MYTYAQSVNLCVLGTATAPSVALAKPSCAVWEPSWKVNLINLPLVKAFAFPVFVKAGFAISKTVSPLIVDDAVPEDIVIDVSLIITCSRLSISWPARTMNMDNLLLSAPVDSICVTVPPILVLP